MGRKLSWHNAVNMGHNHMDHTYVGHTHEGHSYIDHNYAGHSYTGRTYMAMPIQFVCLFVMTIQAYKYIGLGYTGHARLCNSPL